MVFHLLSFQYMLSYLSIYRSQRLYRVEKARSRLNIRREFERRIYTRGRSWKKRAKGTSLARYTTCTTYIARVPFRRKC